jgi:formamidopyrimidine-DNA glycosylase
MPELPDVEKVRRELLAWLAGAILTDVRANDARLVRPITPASFARRIRGARVVDVARRGKWLRIELDGGARVFSHLGMTGDWVARELAAPDEPHERPRFDAVRRGTRRSVRYVDARRFGRLVAARGDIPEWTELGPDPLADGIDARALGAKLTRSARPLKIALMDQTVLAGVGNILATEALFRAKVDPRTPSRAVSPKVLSRVTRALEAEISRELEARTRCGHEEEAPSFAVYGRAGEPCLTCGKALAHVVLAGRGTTYCPRCQR